MKTKLFLSLFAIITSLHFILEGAESAGTPVFKNEPTTTHGGNRSVPANKIQTYKFEFINQSNANCIANFFVTTESEELSGLAVVGASRPPAWTPSKEKAKAYVGFLIEGKKQTTFPIADLDKILEHQFPNYLSIDVPGEKVQTFGIGPGSYRITINSDKTVTIQTNPF